MPAEVDESDRRGWVFAVSGVAAHADLDVTAVRDHAADVLDVLGEDVGRDADAAQRCPIASLEAREDNQAAADVLVSPAATIRPSGSATSPRACADCLSGSRAGSSSQARPSVPYLVSSRPLAGKRASANELSVPPPAVRPPSCWATSVSAPELPPKSTRGMPLCPNRPDEPLVRAVAQPGNPDRGKRSGP